MILLCDHYYKLVQTYNEIVVDGSPELTHRKVYALICTKCAHYRNVNRRTFDKLNAKQIVKAGFEIKML